MLSETRPDKAFKGVITILEILDLTCMLSLPIIYWWDYYFYVYFEVLGSDEDDNSNNGTTNN